MDLEREEILRARAMAPEDKLAAGLRLFDRAWRLMLDGVRHAHPGATEVEVDELARHRLGVSRALERQE